MASQKAKQQADPQQRRRVQGMLPAAGGISETASRSAEAPQSAQPIELLPPSQWPLASTAEDGKLVLKIYESQLSGTDGTVYTSAALSEALGRWDQGGLLLRFTNVVGTPKMIINAENSFDGVRYSIDAGLQFFIFSGQQIRFDRSPTLVRQRFSLALDSGRAEVCVYATNWPPGRRRFGVLVLDKVLVGSIAYYSEPEFNDMLGAVDYLCTLIAAEQGQGTISVDLEESPDGIEWVTNSQVMSFSSIPIDFGGQLITIGETLASKFLRFKVTLGDTDQFANVRIYVVGRGT